MLWECPPFDRAAHECAAGGDGAHFKTGQVGGAPPADLTPQAALEELLGSAAGYGGETSLVAPYDKDLLSLPHLGAAPTPLETVLDGDPLQSIMRFEEVMLKDEDEWGMECERGGHVRPYFDARLARSRTEYKNFVRRLADAGLIRFGTRSQVVVTPFFVYKKDGRRRVIFDCRPANRRFRSPPEVRLGTAGEWAGLRIPESANLYVSSGDIKDYFYACGIGPKLSEYFSLPPLTAQEVRHLGLVGSIDASIAAEDRVFPQLAVMPMGWSWAFYLAQHAHGHLIRKFSDCDATDFLEMGRPAPTLDTDRPRVHAYCDNLSVFGTDRAAVQNRADSIIGGLEESGFTVHEKEEASTYAACVGVEINGLMGRVATKPGRRWKLRWALRWLSTRPWVTGRQVERVIGHAVFVLMLNRPLLAVFRSVYDFVQSSYRVRSRFWGRAAEECFMASALIPFAAADLRRPFCPRIQCFDASETGLGVVEKEVSPTEAESIGAYDDRWRFRWGLYSEARPRENSARILGWDSASSVKPILGVSEGWQLDLAFPEVPGPIIRGHWAICVSRKWRDKEPIFMLEARAGILALRRAVRRIGGFHRRHVLIGDSMVAILALSKGRASHVGLLRQCRRQAALCVAANVVARWRWCASEVNPADAPSRLATEAPRRDVSAPHAGDAFASARGSPWGAGRQSGRCRGPAGEGVATTDTEFRRAEAPVTIQNSSEGPGITPGRAPTRLPPGLEDEILGWGRREHGVRGRGGRPPEEAGP